MYNVNYYHELTSEQQQSIMSAISHILDNSKSVKSAETKLTRFWNSTQLNVPESFKSIETYADHYDEDYFGLMAQGLNEELIEKSEQWECDVEAEKEDGEDYDCPGSEAEREFYNS